MSREVDEQVLRIGEQVLCPDCGSTSAKVARILAPDGQKNKTAEAAKGGVTGAAIGAAIGAIGGPVGVAIGSSTGAFLGSSINAEEAEKTVVVECPHCDHQKKYNPDDIELPGKSR